LPQEAGPDTGGPPLTSIGFDPQHPERFEQVLERTYLGSRDCPALNGTRTAAEALAGHRLAGEFDPARWRLYQAGGSDVGILLMAAHAEQRMWEVVYMGLVPEARGRGYGRAMLLDGLRAAAAAGQAGMFLAVDKSNEFAVRLYESLGFARVGEQAVHLRLGRDARRA
jgi:ribosomal protein S18 acetylase RimI-like enzyme